MKELLLFFKIISSSFVLDNGPLLFTDRPGNYYWLNNTIFPQERYAVISANMPAINSAQTIKYFYDLPIATLAWNRIGFGSFVIITGDKDELELPVNKAIVDELLRQSRENKFSLTLLFVQCDDAHLRIGTGQMSRLFATNYMREHADKLAQTYFIATDADLLPIEYFEMKNEFYVKNLKFR